MSVIYSILNDFEKDIRRVCLEQDFEYHNATPNEWYLDDDGELIDHPKQRRFHCLSRTRPLVEVWVTVSDPSEKTHPYRFQLEDGHKLNRFETTQEQTDYERKRDQFVWALRDAYDETLKRIARLASPTVVESEPVIAPKEQTPAMNRAVQAARIEQDTSQTETRQEVTQNQLTPLQEKIIQAVRELKNDYVDPPDETVAAKVGLNPRGQPYTRETINRERSKLRKMAIEV